MDIMSATFSDDPVRARVATNVRMHRHARRLTLEELSERCASGAGLVISAAALLRVEQGKRGVEAGDLVGLAVALRVAVPDLLAPSVDEGLDDVRVGEARTMPQDEYLGVIGAQGHVGPGAASDGADAVVVPTEQMAAIAAAMAAVGAAAGEAARQFSLVTTSTTSLHAIATAAGGHARRPGRSSAQLRQAGFTTEQLRDRFGPSVAFANALD
jgi:transcriptional regulator with XRE-family HTH domain